MSFQVKPTGPTIEFESSNVPDAIDPSFCQLFEIEYCKVSGEVERVTGISSSGNGKFVEWDFLSLPLLEQLAIQASIQMEIDERKEWQN